MYILFLKENDELKAKEKQQRQQIDLLEANEKELAKKNHSNQKVCYGQRMRLFSSHGKSKLVKAVFALTNIGILSELSTFNSSHRN